MIVSQKFKPRSIQTRRAGPIVLQGLGCRYDIEPPAPPTAFAGRRGFGLLIGAQAQNASQATRSLSDIGTGATVGSTFGPIGTVVGAVVGAIGSLFGPAKEGQAALTWDNMTHQGYLYTTRGTAFDERYIGEAYKGAMDENSNIWPGCGSNGYKNPDCFYSKLADVIAQGYLTGKVPLTASTSQVYQNVVTPWLQSGAGNLFNWAANVQTQTEQGTPLSQQELLIQAAVDRYINGLPITRANMPAYEAYWGTYSQWSTPSLATQIASLTTPAVAPSATTAGSSPVLTTANVLPTAVSAGIVANPSGATATVATNFPVLLIAGLAALYFLAKD